MYTVIIWVVEYGIADVTKAYNRSGFNSVRAGEWNLLHINVKLKASRAQNQQQCFHDFIDKNKNDIGNFLIQANTDSINTSISIIYFNS
jgi:hypothetical protein